MKNNYFINVLLLSCFCLTFFSGYSQINTSKTTYDALEHFKTTTSLFNTYTAESFVKDVDLYDFESEPKSISNFEAHDPLPLETIFAASMLGVGAGAGFGEDQTLWCLHAAYYMRLAMYTRSALYGSFGIVYDGSKINDVTQNLIDLQLRFLMFRTLTQLREVSLVYGALFAYGFGTEKFSGYNRDITRFTAAAVLGLNIILSSRFTLLAQTYLFTYQNTKFKPDNGNDFEVDSTLAFINKRNLLTLSLLINLQRNRQAR
jgi:hypothetical protein